MIKDNFLVEYQLSDILKVLIKPNVNYNQKSNIYIS